MKVVAINGSPRKNGNSAQMLKAAVNGAVSAGAEVKEVQLNDLSFVGCQSCFACKLLNGKSFGSCAVQDDLTSVLEEILQADAVLIAAPIYFGDVPGMVRNLFERIWFPGLLYKKDGSVCYEKKGKVGLIYTMNVPDASIYDALIGGHKGTFERFIGPTEVLCATDTLQFDGYDRYTGDMFDEKLKLERHEKVFPEDCAKAFELGKKLVSK